MASARIPSATIRFAIAATVAIAIATPGRASAAVADSSRWREAILYFAVVDRFADGDPSNNPQVDTQAKGAFHGGDLDGLRERLDEIAELGVTAIWITPVVKQIPGFVTGAGFADWGYHGYWAEDFTRLDPRFGTEADLKALVDACHARGMKVLLDVVYNHVGYNSQYVKNPRTKTWLRTDETGTCGSDDLTSCLSGLPDLKTERKDVADYLFKAHLGLAKRVGLDGFRLDTVKHVAHDFWREHRRRTRAELGSDFFLVGEVWGGNATSLDDWFEADEMDAGFDFSFQGSVLGYLQGRGRTVAFDRYLRSRDGVRPGHLLVHFLSSHDVTGALHELGGDKARFRLAALLQFTSSGIPMIYYGEEVARPGGEWPANRSDMPWGDRKILPGAGKPRDDSLRADYVRLGAIRRGNPALARGAYAGLVAEKDLLVFARRDSLTREAVVVAVNRGAETATATIARPKEWAGAPGAADLWNRESLALAGDSLTLTLPALSARVVAAERTKR
ncbi:MAG TPA: alpha-amylase family glycosyl hydrolase [Acidobacteriota bacterium]|nr:alpha-amylase family glycosyl hydrolase [Acidobacteriota bacterium]